MLLRAFSKSLLNTDRPGALSIPLGSQFQCLTTLSVRKSFFMSSLNLSCTALNHSHMSTLYSREKASASPSHAESLTTTTSDPSLQGCSLAIPLTVYICAWCLSIPSAESCILTCTWNRGSCFPGELHPQVITSVQTMVQGTALCGLKLLCKIKLSTAI